MLFIDARTPVGDNRDSNGRLVNSMIESFIRCLAISYNDDNK